MQNKELGLVQYPTHCTRCNSPILLSQHFFHFSLFQFFNFFFLTFFNQWLRLKVAFCNYQSQLFIRIASGTILQIKNKKQLSATQTQCLKPAKLSPFGNILFTWNWKRFVKKNSWPVPKNAMRPKNSTKKKKPNTQISWNLHHIPNGL